jgi:hypothetical protein
MPTVIELLTAHPAGCLECLVRQTGLRAGSVIQQIDSLPFDFIEGRCGWCAETGPVVAHRRERQDNAGGNWRSA